MRKIILLCVLAIGMMADAQTVQTIAKPLKLNVVKAGTAADSVLVRGADKIVKFVPRSEFGGTPTLQQVVAANGNTDGNIVFTPTNQIYSRDQASLRNERITMSNDGSLDTGMAREAYISPNGFAASQFYGNTIKSVNVSSESIVFFGGGDSATEIKSDNSDFFSVVFYLPEVTSSYQYRRLAALDQVPKVGTIAPASATAPGTLGEIRVTNTHIFWCIAPNTWIRAAGSTW